MVIGPFPLRTWMEKLWRKQSAYYIAIVQKYIAALHRKRIDIENEFFMEGLTLHGKSNHSIVEKHCSRQTRHISHLSDNTWASLWPNLNPLNYFFDCDKNNQVFEKTEGQHEERCYLRMSLGQLIGNFAWLISFFSPPMNKIHILMWC